MANSIKFPTMLTNVLDSRHERCAQMVSNDRIVFFIVIWLLIILVFLLMKSLFTTIGEELEEK